MRAGSCAKGRSCPKGRSCLDAPGLLSSVRLTPAAYIDTELADIQAVLAQPPWAIMPPSTVSDSPVMKPARRLQSQMQASATRNVGEFSHSLHREEADAACQAAVVSPECRAASSFSTKGVRMVP
eukprot:CAMPEP_0181255608 /NCGR_PEP_ID=MMETSP1096-20121128/49245_1 /TAXON_ID=156174 ORGANISM="Chrysochromulina ericina, Strain CCMP281" /NCGR_SAMPLE_ID=MMETSP1096 /ASSEMBLY_ACC=CAM_ASM_000453 /LENGTH=124 /DNA_ID=CAMNT_0023353757 /DNA_START=87 /DNA_END=459 /DNA_ORIENTATION=+